MRIVASQWAEGRSTVDRLYGLEIESIRIAAVEQINVQQLAVPIDNNQQLQSAFNSIPCGFGWIIPNPFNSIVKTAEKRDQQVVLKIQPDRITDFDVFTLFAPFPLAQAAVGDATKRVGIGKQLLWGEFRGRRRWTAVGELGLQGVLLVAQVAWAPG